MCEFSYYEIHVYLEFQALSYSVYDDERYFKFTATVKNFRYIPVVTCLCKKNSNIQIWPMRHRHSGSGIKSNQPLSKTEVRTVLTFIWLRLYSRLCSFTSRFYSC